MFKKLFIAGALALATVSTASAFDAGKIVSQYSVSDSVQMLSKKQYQERIKNIHTIFLAARVVSYNIWTNCKRTSPDFSTDTEIADDTFMKYGNLDKKTDGFYSGAEPLYTKQTGDTSCEASKKNLNSLANTYSYIEAYKNGGWD